MNDNIGNTSDYKPNVNRSEIERRLLQLPIEIENQTIIVAEKKINLDIAVDEYRKKCDSYINNINTIESAQIEKGTSLLKTKWIKATGKFVKEQAKLKRLKNEFNSYKYLSNMGGYK